MEPFLIITGFIVVVVVIALIAWRQEKKRAEGLKACADSLNLIFAKKGDPSLLQSLARFHLFSQGHSKKISNVMTGSANDIGLTIMDYQYTTGGGKNSSTWTQTVILFQSDLLQLPAFVLKPENLFHRIGAAFGSQDIDFDAHPAFSKMYLLRGDEEDAVRSTFKDGLLTYCEQHRKMHAEGEGDRLLFYRTSKKVSPENLRSFMEEGFALFSLMKADG